MTLIASPPKMEGFGQRKKLFQDFDIHHQQYNESLQYMGRLIANISISEKINFLYINGIEIAACFRRVR